MTRLLAALAITASCAPHHGTPRHIVALPPTSSSTAAPSPVVSPSTVAARGSRAAARPRALAPQRGAGTAASIREVDSTGYCLTGTMANGRKAHLGAVAMNGVPFGSRFRVLDGPMAGAVLVVADRIGSGSEFDVAFPGDCPRALHYGRRTVRIEAA